MWLLIGLGLLFLVTRLLNLTILSVFADEAIYIRWSQIIWHDATNRFIPLSDGKPPLFMWLMVPFLKVVPDPLLAGRLLSTLAGLATLIGVYLLTKKLFSKNLAVLVGFFVIFQPFLLFYDRLAIVDSLLTAFGVWAFYLAYLLWEKPDLGKGILLGTIWGGALLTKPSGSYYPPLTIFHFFLWPFKDWGGKFKKLVIPGIFASIYGWGFYNILRLSGAFPMINSRSADYLRSKNDLLSNPFQFLPNTAQVMFSWLVSYLSWFAVVWLILALILAIMKKEKKILVLALWMSLPFLFQAAVGKIVYARYSLIIMPFMMIILGWGFWQVMKERFWLKAVWLVNIKWGLVATIIIPWLLFDWWLWVNPAKAPLHQVEKEQYLQGWAAGYGIKEVADYLKNLNPDKPILVATEGYFGTLPDGLLIYLDRTKGITVKGVGEPIIYMPDELDSNLIKEKQVFLLVNNNRLLMTDQSRLELIAAYPKPAGPKGQEKLLFFKVK